MPRETGYRVRIDAFVKAEPGDIDRLGAVYHAIKKAQGDSEPADLLALAAIEEISIKSQTRNVPAPNASAPIPLKKPDEKAA